MQHIGYSNTSENPPVAARTVSFTINDGDGTANGGHNASVATATINVTSVNDAPIASNVTAGGNEDASSIPIILKATDVDGSIASFKLTGPLPGAAQGTLYANAAMTNAVVAGTAYAASSNALTLYFKPAANFNGPVNFAFTTTDNSGAADSTPATATINVASVNDPIVAKSDTDAATTGSVTTGNLF